MGNVYRAQQIQPIRRIVALKVIRPGFDSQEVLARFESERQALAMMDHPNIAKVLDAGTSDRGYPYFVMEYVHGKPITLFADENKMSINQRLSLFTQACDAIQHAHTKAILHRDIKPGNVLAYLSDNGPAVKVIDFGIAKALNNDRLTENSFATLLGRAVGTYEYMSPEQAAGEADIDTRTDVYSLGVLLYELLIGVKPFERSELARAADAEIRRVIRTQEPARPSKRLADLGDSASTVAALRRLPATRLVQQLRRELEWVPLMAIRKERDRRYASVSQMSLDIENYLTDNPLLAGPESSVYRLKKWTRRNRGRDRRLAFCYDRRRDCSGGLYPWHSSGADKNQPCAERSSCCTASLTDG